MGYNAYFNPAGLSGAGVINAARWRSADVPSANGHGSARGIARVYAALASGGIADGVEVVDSGALADAISEQVYGHDLVLHRPSRFGLGFQLTQPDGPRTPRVRPLRRRRVARLLRPGGRRSDRLRDGPDGTALAEPAKPGARRRDIHLPVTLTAAAVAGMGADVAADHDLATAQRGLRSERSPEQVPDRGHGGYRERSAPERVTRSREVADVRCVRC